MFEPIKFEISAPGKVILFGEHSVVYGKPALAASINKRTSLMLETVPSGDVEIKFPALDLKIRLLVDLINSYTSTRGSSGEVDLEALFRQAKNDVANLENSQNFSHNQNMSLQCVFYLLRGLFSSQKISVGFKITMSSELSIGAGTGSSASFSVCLTAALYQLRRIQQVEEQGNSNSLGKFSSDDKETINEWAFACEQIIHGKASGIDNFVCTYGCVVEMLPCKANQKRKFEVLTEAPKLRVLLINTGISRNTAALVKKVAELRNNNQTVVDLMLATMEEIVRSARTHLLRLNVGSESENEDSFSRLEDLVSLNQGLLSSLGVSHESLDNIVSITKKYGLRSKLTGAGGGGYAISLVPPTASKDEVHKCVDTLQKNGYQVDDIIVGDEGVNIKMN